MVNSLKFIINYVDYEMNEIEVQNKNISVLICGKNEIFVYGLFLKTKII
ncbi:hypothetical protein T190611E02C_10091 [Tenacibaculum sp. 190524A05c]